MWLARRLSLRTRVFLFFALIGAAGLALDLGALVAVWRGAPPEQRHALALWGAGGTFAMLGLVAWVWIKFDEYVARPIERIGRGALAAAHGGARVVDDRDSHYLGSLAQGASAAADALAAARAETAAAVETATAEATRRRKQLETVLRDLDQAVAICTLDHRVLLYNRRAHALLDGCGPVGLGRPILEAVTAQPFEHALGRVRRRFEENRWRAHPDLLSAPFVAATVDGARTLQGRLTLMRDPDGQGASGYVATFDDVTAAHAERLRRDRLLRRGVAEVASALEAAEAAAPTAELSPVRAALARFAHDAEALAATAWPMDEAFSTTLFTAIIRRRSGAQNFTAEIDGDPCWLRCDGVAMVEMLDGLLNVLADGMGVRAFTLSAAPNREGRVDLVLRWRGSSPPPSLLADWRRRALAATVGGVTPDELLAVHGAEIEVGGDGPEAELRLSAPGPSRAHAAPPTVDARPEFYDFDLLDRPLSADMREDAPLRSLPFVVFDTETTGLEPSRGDRIVQIAGLRIVNGRVLRGEAFDILVNPGRRIPAAATRIHRIDDAMVADAPKAADALARFHAFARGSVLVAHNAAFDLRFLTLEAGRDGPRFDQPTLDTVLLAAHLHGQGDSLTLDALAERFAVDLPAEHRHTALGDSLATAEVFLRLLDMLEAQGVRTLGQAMQVSRGAAAIRRRQAAY